MKKLKLQFGSVKEMLTKDQMKLIVGGGETTCYAMDSGGNHTSTSLSVAGENCCASQGNADAMSYSNSLTNSYPYGIDCPCDESTC